MEINIRQHTFKLFPQKAMYWIEKRTLIVSDLHVGKILHFRKAGIALPSQALQNNFDRLNQLMHLTKPERVIFTGDVFHSDRNHEWELFREWRYQFEKTGMHLVLGNHDRLPAFFSQDFHMIIHHDFLRDHDLVFTHHPRENFEDSEYVICGHLHPVVRLSGMANQQLRLPCFHFSAHQVVLPSFGYFTGGYIINHLGNGTVIAIAGDKLIEVSRLNH